MIDKEAVFKEAAELVRRGNCQFHYAEDRYGNPIWDWNHVDAVCYCMSGAVMRALEPYREGDVSIHDWFDAEDELMRSVIESVYSDFGLEFDEQQHDISSVMVYFNDEYVSKLEGNPADNVADMLERAATYGTA